MMFPDIGVPLSAVALDAQTPDLFDLDFRNVEIDPDTGTIAVPSGHVGTWSRAATLSSVSDANGVSYTALDGQMAWEQRDWDNDAVRESFGLRMGTSDRLAFPCNTRAIAMAGLLEMIETGARTSASSCLWSLRNDAASGAGLWLDTSGTYYRLNYRDGSTTRTATLSSGQPVSGDRVQFFWELTGGGVLTFYQSINGAAATSASAAALTLPATWAADAAIRLNSNGTGNAGAAWYRRCRLVAGALDITRIQERR